MMADEPPTSPAGKLLTEISNAMVALHRRHFGRGAGAAKTYVFDDMAVCVLRDIYTPVEKTLLEAGEVETVRSTRLLHQLALEDDYKEPIERLTGRKIRAFLSTVHFDPDLAVEVFIFDHEGGNEDGGPPSPQRA